MNKLFSQLTQKIMFSTVFLFAMSFTLTSIANELNCDVIEYAAGKTATTQQLTVTQSGSTHGDMVYFQGQNFTDITGFVALMQKEEKTYAVLSMNSASTGINASNQTQLVVANQYVQQQLIVPTQDPHLEGIEIQCYYVSDSGK